MRLGGILLVEDDDAIASGLMRVLESQGYGVRRLARGGPAPAAAGADVELVILDLGLPDVDGIDVCRKLRGARPELAILILTARDRELDVVAGLDAGADDYLIKPFRLSELLARVRAHLRRAIDAAPREPTEPLRAGGVTVDLAARVARRGGAHAASEGARPAGAARGRGRTRCDPRRSCARCGTPSGSDRPGRSTRTC